MKMFPGCFRLMKMLCGVCVVVLSAFLLLKVIFSMKRCYMVFWGTWKNVWGLCVYFFTVVKCEKGLCKFLSWFSLIHTTKK